MQAVVADESLVSQSQLMRHCSGQDRPCCLPFWSETTTAYFEPSTSWTWRIYHHPHQNFPSHLFESSMPLNTLSNWPSPSAVQVCKLFKSHHDPYFFPHQQVSMWALSSESHCEDNGNAAEFRHACLLQCRYSSSSIYHLTSKTFWGIKKKLKRAITTTNWQTHRTQVVIHARYILIDTLKLIAYSWSWICMREVLVKRIKQIPHSMLTPQSLLAITLTNISYRWSASLRTGEYWHCLLNQLLCQCLNTVHLSTKARDFTAFKALQDCSLQVCNFTPTRLSLNKN